MSTLHRTTRIALCCGGVALAACARKDNATSDTMAVIASSTSSSTATAPAAPSPVNLADVAGKWNMQAVPTSGDTSATNYVMTATNSTTGWTITLPGRATMPVSIAVDGDSITVTSNPYASVRRKGVQVSTHSTLRLANGDLVGSTTAHYKVKSADSVTTLRTTGTRTR
jgi:hypothetical protein